MLLLLLIVTEPDDISVQSHEILNSKVCAWFVYAYLNCLSVMPVSLLFIKVLDRGMCMCMFCIRMSQLRDARVVVVQ